MFYIGEQPAAMQTSNAPKAQSTSLFVMLLSAIASLRMFLQSTSTSWRCWARKAIRKDLIKKLKYVKPNYLKASIEKIKTKKQPCLVNCLNVNANSTSR